MFASKTKQVKKPIFLLINEEKSCYRTSEIIFLYDQFAFVMSIQFFLNVLYNLLIKEVYRAVYHFPIFIVVKIDYFSVVFHFYDIL